MNLIHFLKSAARNESLLRSYENDFVKSLSLSGKGIDLGAKSKDASYYQYINLSLVEKLDFVDFYHHDDDVIQVNLEKPFPIENNSYDFVILFNVMEHIFNYQNVLDETSRILKNGGELHAFVPFMWRFHPDPNDYFRFTSQALEKLLQEAGFEEVKVVPICYGPFKAGAIPIGHALKFRILRYFLYSMGIIFDKAISLVAKGSKNFSLGYYFYGKKSDTAETQ